MLRRSFTLFLLLAAEVGGLILVLRVPSRSLDQIRTLPPEDAVVAVLRFVALAVACWLAASTILYTIASAIRIPALVRGAMWVTLPGLRRVVDGLVATTVVATSALAVPTAASAAPIRTHGVGPAPTAAPASSYTPRPAGDGVATRQSVPPTTSAQLAYRPHPAGDPAAVAVRLGTSPAPPPSTPAPASSTYVLRVGDHLWSVAARQVAEHTGKRVNELTARDIGRYWMRLVDLNKPHLRSGDPNVVHPGEMILLPDPTQG
jgi:hypothetical protein